jgi:hypothetical protein
MDCKVLENLFPVMAATVGDINASAITGDYVSFVKYRRILVLVAMADGTATTGDIELKLYQATDNAGSDAKVLNCLETGRIYTRYAADYATVAALTTAWTKVTQATADETYTDATSGEACGCIALEVRAEDLDADNKFTHMRADVSATSSSKIIALLYIGADPASQCDPTLMAVPTV